MIVVSDTSPLNYLILIGKADILPALFQRVVAPPSVIVEMVQKGAPEIVAKWAASPPVWLEVVVPKNIDANLPLGTGETEAIGLAQELNADRLLLDERKATWIAKRLGLSVIGTLSVLSLAAEKELLSFPRVIATLRQANFRGPADVIEELLRHDEIRLANKASRKNTEPKS